MQRIGVIVNTMDNTTREDRMFNTSFGLGFGVGGNTSGSIGRNTYDREREILRLVLGTVDVFGIVGNAVSYSMLLRFVGSSSMYTILRTLAISDTLFLLFHLIFNTAFFNLLSFSRLVTQIGYGYFGFVAQTITIWLTVILSIERFVAVRFPFQATTVITIRRTQIAIACIWLITILYKIPLTIVRVHQLVHANAALSCEEDHYSFIATQQTLEQVFWWLETGISIAIVTVCNAQILLVLRRSMIRRGSNSDLSRRGREERKNTVIPLWVVAMFLISVVPEKIYVFLVTFKLAQFSNLYNPLYIFCNFGVVFNSSANVLVYFCNSPKMRRLIADFLCCKCHCKDESNLNNRDSVKSSFIVSRKN